MRRHTLPNRGSTLLLPAFANQMQTKFFTNQIFANRISAPGKPRIALTAYHAKITTRRNTSEWSALEKPVSPPPAESSIPLEMLC
jgi:hypothetical protein